MRICCLTNKRLPPTLNARAHLTNLAPLCFLYKTTMNSIQDVATHVSRLLQSGLETPTASSINPFTTIGAICWYVFLCVCFGVPMLCCCVGCSYIKLRKRRQENEIPSELMDISLARMEANIHVFGEQQERRRKKELLRAFETQSLVITSQQLDEKDSKLSEGCSICLAAYQVGDIVVQSASSESCQHAFHQDCIASWLMTRQSPLCPCCRQPFMDDLSKRSRSTLAVSDHGSSSSEESTSNEDSSSSEMRQGGDEPACTTSPAPIRNTSTIPVSREESVPEETMALESAVDGSLEQRHRPEGD